MAGHRTLSQFEILAGLRKASKDALETGWTRAEMQRETGYSEPQATRLIRRLVESGQVVHIGNKTVAGITGVMRAAPVYKFVSGDEPWTNQNSRAQARTRTSTRPVHRGRAN